MADGEHRRGSVSNNFCTVAGKPCGCGNNYVTPCEAQADGWGDYPQKYTIKNKATKIIEKLRKNQRSFEAHHVLPVACVTETVLAWDEKANADPSVITGTKWCINVTDNMIALPMWGHTIMHYCDNFTALSEEVAKELGESISSSIGNKKVSKLSSKARREISSTVGDAGDTAPKFKDLVQHNYGHTGRSAATGYNKEVVQHLESLVSDIETAQENHETPSIDSIKAAIDEVRDGMKNQLNKRATRIHDGTHQAWKEGMKDTKNWYMCFSMARKPSNMTFPLGKISGGMAKKLADLAQAMWMPA